MSEQGVDVLARHDPIWVWAEDSYRIECGCNEDGLLPTFATREEWAPHVLAELLPLLTPASPEDQAVLDAADEWDVLSDLPHANALRAAVRARRAATEHREGK